LYAQYKKQKKGKRTVKTFGKLLKRLINFPFAFLANDPDYTAWDLIRYHTLEVAGGSIIAFLLIGGIIWMSVFRKDNTITIGQCVSADGTVYPVTNTPGTQQENRVKYTYAMWKANEQQAMVCTFTIPQA
jgi:hypothetical protein